MHTEASGELGQGGEHVRGVVGSVSSLSPPQALRLTWTRACACTPLPFTDMHERASSPPCADPTGRQMPLLVFNPVGGGGRMRGVVGSAGERGRGKGVTG